MKREVFLLGISIIFYVAHAAECEYYKVQKGDTLSDIAEKKGLSVEDILSVNRGLEKGKLITGKRICIPQKNSAQLKGKKEETVKHKVRKGETLSSIAKKYNVSVDDIAKANKLKKREIMVGQSLTIPVKEKHKPILSKDEKRKARGSYTYYVMHKGGRLKDVAKKIGVSLEDLENLNPEYKNRFLAKGVKVKVPKEAKEERVELVKHKVRKGETLSSIAKKYNVSVDDIAKANKLKKREIMVGETLFIPTKGKHEIGVSKREDKPIKVVEEKNEEKNAVNREEVNIGRHSIQMPVDGKIVKAARGVDIITKCESTIKSVEDGKVVYSGGDLQAYGNMVIIEHDDFISLYAYNSKNLVKRGDSVSKGQDIAMVGNKNGSDECVLHFEIRAKDGAPLDPTEYLKNTQ